MAQSPATTSTQRRADRGAASVLLLFAMSAFSVLGVSALTTDLGNAPAGKTFRVLTDVPQDRQTKFVAPIVVPDSWRAKGGDGVYAFQLPVIVPEGGNDESGATAARHAMTDSEVPGLTVCCATDPGACKHRTTAGGTTAVADWTPGADARWLAVRLATRPESEGRSDLITATVLSATGTGDSTDTPIACQLEFQGALVAKGTAYLHKTPRRQASDVPSDLIEGTLNLAVRVN